jgi:hypothetical protein
MQDNIRNGRLLRVMHLNKPGRVITTIIPLALIHGSFGARQQLHAYRGQPTATVKGVNRHPAGGGQVKSQQQYG